MVAGRTPDVICVVLLLVVVVTTTYIARGSLFWALVIGAGLTVEVGVLTNWLWWSW